VRAWPLRRRLVVSILLLIAALSLIVGAVSTLALRGYLVDRLDAQVTAATSRFQGVVDGPRGDDPGRPDPQRPDPQRPGPGEFLPLAGLSPATVGAFARGDDIEAVILGDALEQTPITIAQAELMLAVSPGAAPVTLDLGTGLGEYRLAAVTANDGRTVIIGQPLSAVYATVARLATLISGIAAAALVLAFLAVTLIVRLALRPLDRVAATAAQVAELPLDRGEVALAVRVHDRDADPSTEVGRVGAAINHMLGHVAAALAAREASERKVRTFVADASHELRTPLASIRGYSELTRRGGHELPADVVHALGRIESESERMTSLVEDLLLLARLDDGRSLESLPVDLSALLVDAVSDARAAGPDHEWRVELPDEPVVVLGDAARLHQVVANLLANARVHTPAGTVVTASLARHGDAVELQVVDDGPGIDPALLPTIFERFARGDSSRSRSAGSTGLGLAIVHGVVAAHGGDVRVQSAPASTAFTVRLPARSERDFVG
jgi:two-component system OmpR family sensor kinase